MFLSTLSLRRATFCRTYPRTYAYDFYPRSPCGERPAVRLFSRFGWVISIHALLAESDGCNVAVLHGSPISIHALLAESDVLSVSVTIHAVKFLSTLSLRRATRMMALGQVVAEISIHALLAESDRGQGHRMGVRRDFYPRSPCGERRGSQPITKRLVNFYPRSPCGERPIRRCCPAWR